MSALKGIRIVEIAGDSTAFAGKLLADMGADLILVEPPGGAAARAYPPFVDDQPGLERSLHWWHYHTSKRGITLDLTSGAGRVLFEQLVCGADVLIDGPGDLDLEACGVDCDALREANPGLIHAAISAFGRHSERRGEPVTDLTLLAGGGPVWSCGYDDHTLPPVRGGGFQGYHTGAHYAVMAILTALLYKQQTGAGQFIDVSQHAAANVTTEMASYNWLVAGGTVQRQTGRHAFEVPTAETQARTADGNYVNTGVLPRTPREFKGLLEWLEKAGLRDELPESVFLEMAAQRDHLDRSKMAEDPEMVAMFTAARDAMTLISSRSSAKEFFLGAQEAGIPAGAVYSPEEAFEDEHFVTRGFQQELEHPELHRSFRYPGAPYRFEKSPWTLSRRAPRLGEHNEEVLAELGVDADELERLRSRGVV
jgi:crotonobetainyl-CoA:carnitine CoA-transferase CaiB-like acyl-CoA transferase